MTNTTILLTALLLTSAAVFARRSFTKRRTDFEGDCARKLRGAPRRRIVVGGMMGSGKTTFSGEIAGRLNLRHIEIDSFASEEEIVKATESASSGWVAEANPWQIPSTVAAKADTIIFLDYDNLVNYTRLLWRGFQEWAEAGFTVSAFKGRVVDRAILDLGRIVYRYGKANRDGWRERGMLESQNGGSAVTLRCISPAELSLLAEIMVTRDA